MNHLLSVDDLSVGDIEHLMTLTGSFAEVLRRSVPKVPALRGKTVVLAFFEDSTRTRSSFDLAARRLSADVVTFATGASSLSKGESIRDTVETITAMGVDGIVVRHPHPGIPAAIERYTPAAVVNAGDGRHQHPTQSLLDLYTLQTTIGSIEGKRILLCGDIMNSRVARSNVAMFTKMGAEVIICGPHSLLPPHRPNQMFGHPVEIVKDIDAVIGSVDVAYMLRIQNERIADAALPSIREYRATYGLTAERARRMASHAVVMHPGPINRGVEIDADVADSERSLITAQVGAGVGVRMAVLYQLLGPGKFDTGGEAAGEQPAAADRFDDERLSDPGGVGPWSTGEQGSPGKSVDTVDADASTIDLNLIEPQATAPGPVQENAQ